MSIAKVIEVLAEGETLEEAAHNAVTEAGKTVNNIKHIYLRDPQGIVENEKIVKFRVNAKITFVVEN